MNRLLKKLEKIGRDPKTTAKAVGLRYVSDSSPGYTRKKAGKGWSYYDKDGKLVKDRGLIVRFDNMVIPHSIIKQVNELSVICVFVSVSLFVYGRLSLI